MYRRSRSEVFCKKGVLENFAKFTGKHLCQGLFFNKVAGLRPTTLLKRDSRTGVFVFLWILRNLWEHFFEHVRWLFLYVFEKVTSKSSFKYIERDQSGDLIMKLSRVRSLKMVFWKLFSNIQLCRVYNFDSSFFQSLHGMLSLRPQPQK